MLRLSAFEVQVLETLNGPLISTQEIEEALHPIDRERVLDALRSLQRRQLARSRLGGEANQSMWQRTFWIVTAPGLAQCSIARQLRLPLDTEPSCV